MTPSSPAGCFRRAPSHLPDAPALRGQGVPDASAAPYLPKIHQARRKHRRLLYTCESGRSESGNSYILPIPLAPYVTQATRVLPTGAAAAAAL